MDGPLGPDIDDDQSLTAQLPSGLIRAYSRSSWTRPGPGCLTQSDSESNVDACCDQRQEQLFSVLSDLRKRERSWLVQRYGEARGTSNLEKHTGLTIIEAGDSLAIGRVRMIFMTEEN